MPLTELERSVWKVAAQRSASVSPEQRRVRGIVHTPPELARFVARATDRALRRLGRTGGVADRDVTLLDPACGPGAFLAAALAVADGASAPRAVVGLDVDPNAVEAAELVLGPTLGALGWPLRLTAGDTLGTLAPLAAQESNAATVAILGNPPWAGRAASRAPETAALLEDFRREADGSPLRERKVGVLSDDYVRFWRWAAEVASSAEGGAVVTLVTNASFLDGPVHRGMRAFLTERFAEVDVLHLGGSALIARRGDRDENVFGVRPAVCVTRAVRPPGHLPVRAAKVRFTRLRGTREEKLARLGERAGFDGLRPRPVRVASRAPLCLFTPAPERAEDYDGWPSLDALMPFHREGLQSNRDAFCLDADRERLEARVRAFAAGELGPFPGGVDRPSGHYDPDRGRAALRAALEAGDEVVRAVAYRPFDRRWGVVVAPVCHRPRPSLWKALAHGGPVLLTVRKDRGERPWAHVAATDTMPDNCFLSARSSCRTRAFPAHDPDGAPNLDPVTLSAFAANLDGPPTSAEVIRYALAVLSSETYRARFDAHLHLDYPRLPPPPDEATFRAVVEAGEALEAAFDLPNPVGDADDKAVVVGHHRIPDGDGASALHQARQGAETVLRGILAV